MKTLLKIVLGLFFYCTLVNAKEDLPLNNEIKEYDKIFQKIAEKRVGADIIMIDQLDNPFIIEIAELNSSSDSNDTAQTPIYILEATFEQKAKINGSWYKKNENIGPFQITKISRDSVILQNEIEKKELVIRTKDERNIKIFTK